LALLSLFVVKETSSGSTPATADRRAVTSVDA
jgi:hypothetical protein